MHQDGKIQVGDGQELIDVGVVGSDDKSRQFMAAVVGGTPGLRTLCACATGREALRSFSKRPARLVLVSLFLPDMAGTELIRRVRALWPEVPFILLVPSDRHPLLFEALESGARGYLSWPGGAEELVRAIWSVLQGGAAVSNALARSLVDHFRARGEVLNLLTERERQVLRCLALGRNEQAIGAELRIDKATAHSHVRNLLAKLDVHSAAQAVARYLNPKLPPTGKHWLPAAYNQFPGLAGSGSDRLARVEPQPGAA